MRRIEGILCESCSLFGMGFLCFFAATTRDISKAQDMVSTRLEDKILPRPVVVFFVVMPCAVRPSDSVVRVVKIGQVDFRYLMLSP